MESKSKTVSEWTLEDGTTVALGGAVTGGSGLAELLRARLDAAKAGHVSSGYGDTPFAETLDVSVAHLVDWYLRHHFKVLSGPAVKYPKITERPAPPLGAMY